MDVCCKAAEGCTGSWRPTWTAHALVLLLLRPFPMNGQINLAPPLRDASWVYLPCFLDYCYQRRELDTSSPRPPNDFDHDPEELPSGRGRGRGRRGMGRWRGKYPPIYTYCKVDVSLQFWIIMVGSALYSSDSNELIYCSGISNVCTWCSHASTKLLRYASLRVSLAVGAFFLNTSSQPWVHHGKLWLS